MLVQDYKRQHVAKDFGLDKFFTEIWTSNSNNTVIEVFGAETLGITNQIMYPVSMSLSLFSGVKSVADYLINGPLSIESDKRGDNIVIMIAKWIYVMSEFLNKFVICWTSSELFGDIKILGLRSGLGLFFGLLVLFVVFPGLIVIAPIIRYPGFLNIFKLCLHNPQLLTLPLITDFAFGPSTNNEKFCGLQVGWACFRCCCCCCCCMM